MRGHPGAAASAHNTERDVDTDKELDPSVVWHNKNLYVSALCAAAEHDSNVDEEWLHVVGGAEALGRSLQKALIDRVCNRMPPQLQVCGGSKSRDVC